MTKERLNTNFSKRRQPGFTREAIELLQAQIFITNGLINGEFKLTR